MLYCRALCCNKGNKGAWGGGVWGDLNVQFSVKASSCRSEGDQFVIKLNNNMH